MIERVISGGQTGVDQVALITARELGISTGGWAPKHWMTSAGSAPWLADFGLLEHPEDGYPPRTHANVRDSDGTLIFGWPYSRGCILTQRYCTALRKSSIVCVWPNASEDMDFVVRYAKRWIRGADIKVLNVAGNREEKNPGVSAACRDFLRGVLK